MFRTLLADLESHVSPLRHTGARYWIQVIGKALLGPAGHATILFRLSTVLYRNPVTRPLAFLVRLICVTWSGVEIHPNAQIGPGLCLVHSQKILIGKGVRIGRDARICHGVSIGGDTGRPNASDWPTIGDGVLIGMDAIIMGGVTVGDGARIGAQAFVVRDVPAYGVMAAAPATLLRVETPAEAEAVAPTSGV